MTICSLYFTHRTGAHGSGISRSGVDLDDPCLALVIHQDLGLLIEKMERAERMASLIRRMADRMAEEGEKSLSGYLTEGWSVMVKLEPYEKVGFNLEDVFQLIEPGRLNPEALSFWLQRNDWSLDRDCARGDGVLSKGVWTNPAFTRPNAWLSHFVMNHSPVGLRATIADLALLINQSAVLLTLDIAGLALAPVHRLRPQDLEMENEEVPAAPVATVALEVQIDADWYQLIVAEQDLFGQGYCGSWARSCLQHGQTRLVYEHGGDYYQSRLQVGNLPDWERARAAFESGALLPAGWHRFDAEFAKKAFAYGVQMYGLERMKDADAADTDWAVQMALFNQIRYQ